MLQGFSKRVKTRRRFAAVSRWHVGSSIRNSLWSVSKTSVRIAELDSHLDERQKGKKRVEVKLFVSSFIFRLSDRKIVHITRFAARTVFGRCAVFISSPVGWPCRIQINAVHVLFSNVKKNALIILQKFFTQNVTKIRTCDYSKVCPLN